MKSPVSIKNLKNNKMNIMIILIVVVAIYFLYKKKSNYVLSPEPITITSSAKQTGDIFSLPYSISCVPGPDASGEYYTKDLTPGGICGGQEFVRSQAEDYQIVGGIGVPLLEQ